LYKTDRIFGSYIRGEENEKSDIDILVEFDSPIDIFKFIELEIVTGQYLFAHLRWFVKNI
jgi:predicted nucleotidyltransferase